MKGMGKGKWVLTWELDYIDTDRPNRGRILWTEDKEEEEEDKDDAGF